jgi:antitoxin (DNA-binding transcriptional repressor) of toxin-antitoxin stability system
MAYTTYEARTHLSLLLRDVESGQEVIILRGK